MKLRINDNGLIRTFTDEEIIYILRDEKNIEQKKAIKKTFNRNIEQIKIIGVINEYGTRFFIYKIINGKMYVIIQQVPSKYKEFDICKNWNGRFSQ